MCAIAGIIDRGGRLGPERLRSLAAAMARAQAHRGPDHEGVWLSPDGVCALSHRRLSVIDPSPAANQPMAAGPDGPVLTYNGELYNHAELARALAAEGASPQGRGDSAVLLAGLARHGAAFLDRIDGMYAFALYDPARRELLLARDPFGQKPLYCLDRPDLFAFASELDALTLLPGFDPAVDADRLFAYLSLQYVPAPWSIYRAAEKLPPGTALRVGLDGRRESIRHFSFQSSADAVSGRNIADLADELDDILRRTVARMLVGDVPVGAFLSGGVDSATVLAILRRALGRDVDSFSLGFADVTGEQASEHAEARAIAAHLGARPGERHHEHILPPDAAGLAPRIGALLDEPNGDTSCLPTWILSGFARRRVTVALSGDGGDEMFGGYGRYADCLEEIARRDGEAGWSRGGAYYSGRILVFGDPSLTELGGAIPPGAAARLAGLRRAIDGDRRPPLNVMRDTDAANYLPGAVLAKMDRMSMRHALEVRAPLLGREVASFAASLAAADCFDAGTGRGKTVLRAVGARYLPAGWLERPKRGFGLPGWGWAAEGLLGLADALLDGPDCRLAHWIPTERLAAFRLGQRRDPNTYRLWSLIVLESWLRTHPAEPCR